MDDEIIEELDDENIDEEEQNNEPTFKRRVMDNNLGRTSALKNKSLLQKNGNNRLTSKNKPVSKLNTKGLPPKDQNATNKLKRKNKPLSLLNRKKSNNNEEAKTDSQNDEQQSEGQNFVEDIAALKKKILIIKISLIIGVILVGIFFIISIIAYVASIFGISMEFSNLGKGNTDVNSEYYAEANAYYKSLNEATELYADSCGIYLNRNYIHASLAYRDFLEQNNDMKARYIEMSNNTKEVAKLMVTNCVVDYEIGGTFYNNLKNSAFFNNYYGKYLDYIDADSIVTNIFEYASVGIELAGLSSGYISDNLKVNMGTCEYPYNKILLNEGTNYSSTVGFRDYIMGVIYGEVEGHITASKKEFLKAFAITATSYALGRSGYKSGDEEIWVHNGNCWQLSCDINEGCHYTKELPGGYGTTFTGPDSSGKYWKDPISASQRALLDEVLNEVWGTVLVNTSGEIIATSYRNTTSICNSNTYGCLGQNEAANDALQGMDYKAIIEKYYDNYSLSNMKEDAYAPDVSYSDGRYKGSVVFYAQTDYLTSFCGTQYSIKSSGCGVVSMAMVLSTFVDKSYDPITVMREAQSGNFCGPGISGTNASFFAKSATTHGLGYQSVSKNGNLQLVLDALKSGNSLVIAHMGPGSFTSGGHYIVLSAVSDDGKVYVNDPYDAVNKTKRKTGNGWYDFNDVIVKQLKSKGQFHIITKR